MSSQRRQQTTKSKSTGTIPVLGAQFEQMLLIEAGEKRKAPTQPQKGTKKQKKQKSCSNCHQPGHNILTCRVPRGNVADEAQASEGANPFDDEGGINFDTSTSTLQRKKHKHVIQKTDKSGKTLIQDELEHIKDLIDKLQTTGRGKGNLTKNDKETMRILLKQRKELEKALMWRTQFTPQQIKQLSEMMGLTS